MVSDGYVERFGPRAHDERLRDRNKDNPCTTCNGTGNMLYAMFRACPDCSGSGQAPASYHECVFTSAETCDVCWSRPGRRAATA